MATIHLAFGLSEREIRQLPMRGFLARLEAAHNVLSRYSSPLH